MKGKKTTILLVAGIAIFTSVQVFAAPESEPNSSIPDANPIIVEEDKTGSITTSDVDYFSFSGVNTGWGVIALLETDQSTASSDGVLQMLGNVGTVLQQDTGSWVHGSGIALQNYADGNVTHYFTVNEQGDDDEITSYSLRYYSTIVNDKAERESNETPATGAPSSFTNSGVLSSASDIDCFVFHGRAGDSILLAVNGDPEGDGSSPADIVLTLYDTNGAELAQADISGQDGNEFIEYEDLPAEGVYSYCLSVGAGTGGVNATYLAGIMRNYRLYFSSYSLAPTWLNPREGGVA